jgi:hypothetical protein
MLRTDNLFKSNGFLWQVEDEDVAPFGRERRRWIAHAICPSEGCNIHLDFSGGKREVTCFNCGKSRKIHEDFEALRIKVNEKYKASRLKKAEIINLDLVPTSVSASDEDDNFWVKVKMGQKNGKRVAVVYIGEKANKTGEKVQLFVDLEKDQLRADLSDIPPEQLLSVITAVFKESKQLLEARKQ